MYLYLNLVSLWYLQEIGFSALVLYFVGTDNIVLPKKWSNTYTVQSAKSFPLKKIKLQEKRALSMVHRGHFAMLQC